MLFFSTRTPKKYQGSPDQPSTAPTDAAQCAVGRKDAFSDWFALWSSSPEWFGRWTADGEIWRLGWSTKEPWQPWWFSPVFYERFRDLGRKHGDQMGSSWENSWEVMGCFGTNTMKYECVWKWRINAPPIDVSFHSEKDDETVDEIGPYCQTHPRCTHMG